VRLESLSTHLEVCNFNLCLNCGLKMGKTLEHNCVQLLKQELIQQKQEFEESLKQELVKKREELEKD
jgi:hypothetical protein